MAEMQDLHQPLLLMDSVVDQNWAVNQFAYPRPLASRVSRAWEPAEQFDVIEQCLAKTGRGLVVVLSDMPHDLGEIA